MSSTPTPRDHVWDAVLAALQHRDSESVTVDDVRAYLSEEVAKTTLYEALWAIHDLDIVDIDDSDAQQYKLYETHRTPAPYDQ